MHVFVASGRFRSDAGLRRFVDATYSSDGEMVPSQFMREVELLDYEPMCIECIHSMTPLPLIELLQGVSNGDQWLPKVGSTLVAKSAICVFTPNVVARLQRTSLQYVGAFDYE